MNSYPAQESIYSYFLDLVRSRAPDEVLREFKNLFVYHVASENEAILNYLQDIVLDAGEEPFKYTLQRSCYILFNNWEANRQYEYIPKLVRVFDDAAISQSAISPVLKKQRAWLQNFLESKAFNDLQLFVWRYDTADRKQKEKKWSDRYIAYCLVPQYADPNNSEEQRQVARVVSQRLKDKFKFELAMYVTRSQMASYRSNPYPNPTILGDNVLRLIEIVLSRRGQFNYESLASLFLEQTARSRYSSFKKSLNKYLLYAWGDKELANTINTKLADKIQGLYPQKNDDRLDDSLLLRTCNRVIDSLTTENGRDPPTLFILLLSNGNPLTLAIALLKLILISPHSRIHLETRIAQLIAFYEQQPESECQWTIRFFEVFKVTLAVYAENVKYQLVKIDTPNGDRSGKVDMKAYRVFAQVKTNVLPGKFDPAELEDGGDRVSISRSRSLKLTPESEEEELETLFSR